MIILKKVLMGDTVTRGSAPAHLDLEAANVK
jgi:hypothetical protein